jgi:hypothetical protein
LENGLAADASTEIGYSLWIREWLPDSKYLRGYGRGNNGHTKYSGETGAVLSERILKTGMVARKDTDYCDTAFAGDNSAQDDRSDKQVQVRQSIQNNRSPSAKILADSLNHMKATEFREPFYNSDWAG